MTDDDTWMDHDISASAVKTHAKCPKQYELKYERDDIDIQENNQYFVMGSLVHDSIEAVLNEYIDVGDNFGSKNEIARKMKAEFYSREESGEYETELMSEDLRNDGVDSLDVAAKYLADRDPDIRDVEKKSYFELSEVKSTVLGFIDVATENPNEIWDWKTGNAPDGNDRGELIQGAMYMGAYFQEYGELPEVIRFVYIKEGEVRSFDASEDNWERMMKYARKLMNDKRSGNYRADPERDKCYWCSYEQYCSASDVSIAKLQEEIDNGNPEMWDSI